MMRNVERTALKSADVETMIADMPHHDSLVFELWANNKHLAEIFFEEGAHKIEIFSNSEPGQSWIMQVDDLVALLQRGKQEIPRSTSVRGQDG